MRKTVNNYELMKDLDKKPHLNPLSVIISNINTGFIECPCQISLNIYVQGCKMRCEGCQNPELQPFEGGSLINLQEIEKVLEHHSLSTWICWLGGDAIYQPDGFKAFNKLFKEKNYKVCLYTGAKQKEITDLLDNVDVVIDGEWSGTPVTDNNSNQKVYIKNNNQWGEHNFAELKEKLKESVFCSYDKALTIDSSQN